MKSKKAPAFWVGALEGLRLVMRLGEAVGLAHVTHEVDDSVGVADLVVVPADELEEGGGELDAGAGVENGGVGAADEVG